MFTRLDTQFKKLIGGDVWPQSLARRWERAKWGFCGEIPEAFTSIEQARNTMDFLWNDIMNILGNADEQKLCGYDNVLSYAVESEKYSLLGSIAQFSDALDTYLDDPDLTLSPKEINAGKTLKMYTIHGRMALETFGAPNELVWDQHLDSFKHILQLAKDVVTSKAAGQSSAALPKQGHSPSFNLDMGLVQCLAEIVWRCRDLVTRREAIKFLEGHPRQEGLWDGVLVAKCGYRFIEIEEGPNGENLVDGVIPDWSRISQFDCQFDIEERSAVLAFVRGRSSTDNSKVRLHEVVRW